jgi:hypothetical protein
MTSKGLAPIALAAAMLAAAAPALAGSGGATELQIEQLGPKHAVGSRSCHHHAQYVSLASRGARTCPRVRYIAVATHSIPITQRTLDVEELGPKHLLH